MFQECAGTGPTTVVPCAVQWTAKATSSSPTGEKTTWPVRASHPNINYAMIDDLATVIVENDAASAVGSGLRAGFTGEAVAEGSLACSACGEPNDADAKFCDSCGESITRTTTCANCGTDNDPAARFCDQCGRSLQRG